MNKTTNIKSIGIGRRKEATATVKLLPGSGEIMINNLPAFEYLQLNVGYLNACKLPLELAELDTSYNVEVQVKGGGLNGQTEAIRLGITRALCKIDNAKRPALKAANLLTRDARVKERKKYGLKKARKASQYSKR